MSPIAGLRPTDIARFRFIRGAQLSHDGRNAAYAVSRCDQELNREFCEIRVHNLTSDRDWSLRSGQVFATHPRWAPNSERLAYVMEEGGASRVEICELSASSVQALEVKGMRSIGPAVWSPDGGRLASIATRFSKHAGPRKLGARLYRADGLGYFEDLRQELVLLDASSGKSEICPCELGTMSYIEWDLTGSRILILATPAAVPFASYSPRLYILDLKSGVAREVIGEGWFITHARWVPGADRIVIVGACNSKLTVPETGLWTIDPDGAHPRCHTQGLCGNVGLRMHHDMPIWDVATGYSVVVPASDRAIATVQSRGAVEICAISLEGEPAIEPIVSGERTCLLLDASRVSNQMLYAASDIREPTDLYVTGIGGRPAERKLTTLNAEVMRNRPETELGYVKVKSDDGLDVDAWFLRPKSPGPLPTVLFIHGGPFSSTGNIFRFDFHLLATNGIAVMFHNFRGSSGYGEAFSKAIMGDWGARGFPDHMAAVDGAISHGFADASRIGVWGASHGGFATCWLVCHTNRFRAALAEAAVTNFTTAYYLSDAPDAFARDLGGRPDEIPDVYRSRSPISYAQRCVTPVLLLHGEDDLRCPIEEAEQFHRALLDAGCTSELIRIEGANHLGDSIGSVSARIAQNEALLEWFRRRLSPD